MDPLTFPEILEDQATGEVRIAYEEIKRTLGVSMVNFFWRAMAVHPNFFLRMWAQLKPNAESQYLETKADELRALALLADSNRLPRLDKKLRRQGWSSAKLDDLRQKVNSYRYVSAKLLLLVASIDESLAQGRIGGTGILSDRKKRTGVVGSPDLPMAALGSPPIGTLRVLADIKAVHHWHGIASGYRTLALYPDFLKLAWQEVVRPVVRNKEYNSKANELYWISVNYGRHLPFQLNLSREWLAEVGIRETEGDEIKTKVGLFHGFISDFLIDVQRIKASLDGASKAETSSAKD